MRALIPQKTKQPQNTLTDKWRGGGGGGADGLCQNNELLPWKFINSGYKPKGRAKNVIGLFLLLSILF